MSKQWLIAGKKFATTQDLRNYVQHLLKQYPSGSYLPRHDAQFVLGLLKHHPDAEDKLAGVTAGVMVVTRDGGKGFTLHKETGELVPFSWQKCITPPTPQGKFSKVCRNLIRPDVLQARDKAFAGAGFVSCPYTGEVLTPKTCHMDHQPPNTFSVILKRFMQEWGIDPAAVVYVHGDGVTTFRDAQLAKDWIGFHALYARLRPVSAQANLYLIPNQLKELKK